MASQKSQKDSKSTRNKLIKATVATLRDQGITGVSARNIAKTADLNQALVFYHFQSVNDLIGQACIEETAARVELYRPRFAEVSSFAELVTIGKSIHEEESKAGNVTVLAHVLAGAQQNQQLAEICRTALGMWIEELESVLNRVISKSVFDGIVETSALARAVAASFVGMELYEGADRAGAAHVFALLEPLAVLAEMVDDLGVIPRKAIKAKLRKATSTRSAK